MYTMLRIVIGMKISNGYRYRKIEIPSGISGKGRPVLPKIPQNEDTEILYKNQTHYTTTHIRTTCNDI